MIKKYILKYKKKRQAQRKRNLQKIKNSTNQTMTQVWNTRFAKFNMFNFKHMKFSTHACIWLLILLVAFGRIFGQLSAWLFYIFMHQHLTVYYTQYDLRGTLNVITTTTTELIPILFVAWIWGNRKWFMNQWILHGWSKHPYLHKRAQLKWFKPFIKDIKILSKDIWNHKMIIIISTIIVTIIHTLATFIFTLMSGPTISSPYDVQLAQLLHQNWLLYPVIILVAPVFEELIFRAIIPKLFDRLFDYVKRGSFEGIKYWLAAIISAMSYASLHEGSESNWGVLASFVVLSLLFQWLYKHSKSLSLPIAVHGLSNLLVLLPDLFM